MYEFYLKILYINAKLYIIKNKCRSKKSVMLIKKHSYKNQVYNNIKEGIITGIVANIFKKELEALVGDQFKVNIFSIRRIKFKI